MKKILSILGAIGLTSTITTTLISCEKPNNNENDGGNKPEPNKPQQPPVGSKGKFIPSGTEVKEDNKEYIVIYGDQVQKGRIIKTNAKDINHRGMGSTHAKIYCGDGLNELEIPEINKDTGLIIDGKE